MVISCAAVNCTNRQGKVDKTEISFHRFPINNARRLARWRRAVRREGWVPNKYSFLCSKHFSPDCFQQRYDDQHRQLKDTAVPSIFDFTPPARGAAGNVRKKVLSPAPGPAEEEDEEEEKIPSEKPRLKAASKSLRNISPPGRESLKAGQDTNRPPRTPQQAVGEWSLGSAEEVFTPSSCTFIDALHSYSSTSRQERDTRARQRRGGQGGGAGGAGAAPPSAAALGPQAQLPQEAAGSAGPPRCRATRYSISARRQQLRRSARQLRRRARQLRSLLQPRKTGLLDKAGPSLPTGQCGGVSNNNNYSHLYSAFLDTPHKALYRVSTPLPPMCSSTWMMRRQP
ncbi:peroxynitrite isomerase THAP4-like [Lepisosteus oculatus]|uniref:peroxynitrite isomerase THAP4-like n=1 Tax=Lepisosteus oculatus TaxID=7918 RepID=UPI0035F52C47